MSDLERFPTMNLKFDKEIPDVLEFVFLGAGRLVLHVTEERKAIVLDNVLFINSCRGVAQEPDEPDGGPGHDRPGSGRHVTPGRPRRPVLDGERPAVPLRIGMAAASSGDVRIRAVRPRPARATRVRGGGAFRARAVGCGDGRRRRAGPQLGRGSRR